MIFPSTFMQVTKMDLVAWAMATTIIAVVILLANRVRKLLFSSLKDLAVVFTATYAFKKLSDLALPQIMQMKEELIKSEAIRTNIISALVITVPIGVCMFQLFGRAAGTLDCVCNQDNYRDVLDAGDYVLLNARGEQDHEGHRRAHRVPI